MLEICGGDEEQVRFLQRCIGYSISGDPKEQVVFIAHGSGANGKSTLVEVFRSVLGDYAGNAQPATFLRQHDDTRPRGDLARLAGVRLVTVAEIPENRHLDESLVKQLTGGDPVTARELYKNEFEYRPQFKLFVSTNTVKTHLANLYGKLEVSRRTQAVHKAKELRLIP